MGEQQQQVTVIGPDTFIRGEMSFEQTARVLGRFEGRIIAAGEVQIGETADCKASIEASSAVIDGALQGDIVAQQRVTLNARARVHGDITAATLVVAEGATFIGHCRVGPEALRQGETSAEARSIEPKPRVVAEPASSGELASLEARLARLARGPAAAEHAGQRQSA